MARTLDINYARLTSTPQTAFDPQTGSGTITAAYVVGNLTNGAFRDHPTATLVGTASIVLGPTDTAPPKLAELIGEIAAQEGLTVAAQGGTDQIFDSAGNHLA